MAPWTIRTLAGVALVVRLARADDAGPPGTPPELGEVVVEAPAVTSSASSEEIPAERFDLRPHARMIELLRNIPGLVVAQHQGGNKAPQYLIRGFDADHGTDFAVSVDDVPVNLRSHAHGQGYADVNFVIPETVERYRLFKGPYFLQLGDFANAGALDLVTRDAFERSFVLAEGGSFGTQRYVAGVSPRLGKVQTLFAGQAFFTDGPFEHAENLARYNGLAKLTLEPSPASKLALTASVYQGDWDASGQIPLREVSAGRLDRFGAIDPTEGGRTDRESVDARWTARPTPEDEWSVLAYAVRYELRLWSDFTFFRDTGLRFIETPDGGLVDMRDAPPVPGARYVPGDGIEQSDARWLWGARARWAHDWTVGDRPVRSQLGVETRSDDVDLALWRQVRRERFFPVNRLKVTERSFSGWLGHEVFLTDWLRLEAGLRGDVFTFAARNRLPLAAVRRDTDPNFTGVLIDGGTWDGIVSPKANLVATPVPDTDLYLNFGEGFHSNDARNALLARGADFTPLTRSLGYEAGVRTRQLDRLDAAAAVWLLDLDSELVFSGDAGNQETGAGGSFQPAGASRRWGVDFETRYEIRRWLVADYDLAFADPRFVNGDAIPLAPTLLMNGGLTVRLPNGLSVGLRGRFLDDRPANEARTLVARGWFLLDLVAGYRWRDVEASLQLQNLTDTDWREAQFADTSCVRRQVGRAAGCAVAPGKQAGHARDPVPDIHFTPGSPFGVLAGVKVYF
jgi:hypothetical protein